MTVHHTQLDIRTPDGVCETHAVRPAGAGAFPAVLMYMDGIGMRPALVAIAERIAGQGYFVLLPDLFYRIGFRVTDARKFFLDPDARADFMMRVLPSTPPALVMKDTTVFLDHLASHPLVRPGPIGITGYCMGGRLGVYAAGTFGDQIACVGAFHPSSLATDAPDSPHRLAPSMKGELYIAGASDDAGFDDAQKARFADAMTDSDVSFTLETYPARHGWVPADTPVHDPAQAERHFTNLFALLGRTIDA